MKIEANVVKRFDTGTVKAVCDVTLDGAFVIHGVKLIKGQKGDFVSMPSDTWENSQGEVKHKDIVHPLNSEIRTQLFKAVSNAYEAQAQGIANDDIPFDFN